MSEEKAVQKREEKAITYQSGENPIKLTIGLVRQQLANPTKSGALPEDNDVVKFMMLCQAQKLNPWEGDAFLVGYDSRDGAKFSLITSLQSLLKRAQNDKQYDGKESGLIVTDGDGNVCDRKGAFLFEGDTLRGAWCKVHLKHRNHGEEKRIMLAAYSKQNQFWDGPAKKALMIVKCAEAGALRAAFPALGGYIAEEMHLERDVTSSVEVEAPQPIKEEDASLTEGQSMEKPEVVPPKKNKNDPPPASVKKTRSPNKAKDKPGDPLPDPVKDEKEEKVNPPPGTEDDNLALGDGPEGADGKGNKGPGDEG